MAGVRKALIVATDQYSDPKLTQLNAPAEDARALAEVLQDPDVGAYDVQTVLNKTCQEVEIAIASFFQSGARDDTLLLHFSCHGVKDLSGELYFATTDTKLPLLKVTGVSSSMVKNAMEESRASLILCLVDCCYSGAFTKSTKAAATVDLTERLGGRGRAVITASTSLQLALDGQEEPSLFTHAVLEGLRSGDADRDLDGLVTLDEFYNYIHEKVTEKNPDQTPVKSFDVQGEVYVARRGAPITTPAPLPRDVVDWLATGEDWQRLGAVSKLGVLLNAGHPGRALGARQALEKVRDHDDSNKVRKAAEHALADAGDTEAIPLIPAYTEGSSSRLRTEPSREIEEAGATRSATITPDSGGVGLADLGAASPVTETPTGGGATPTQPDPGDGGRGFRRWGIPIAAALSVLLLVVAGWVAASLIGGDDGNETTGDNGDNEGESDPGVLDGGTKLADSEMLVVSRDGAGVRRLRVVDVERREARSLLVDVGLPTIDRTREYMIVMVKKGQADVPIASKVDGYTDKLNAVPKDDRSWCPATGRPALGPENAVALVCKDVPDSVIGLFVLKDGDERLHQLAEDAYPREGPTWDDDGNIYFSSADFGDRTVLRRVSSDGGGSEQITDDGSSWDSHPDWSQTGDVLFLRSPDGERKGDVWRLQPDRTEDQLTTVRNAQSPTWSPDGRQFAYLAPHPDDADRLIIWIQDAEPGATATPIIFTDDNGDEDYGVPGPPAWGTR